MFLLKVSKYIFRRSALAGHRLFITMLKPFIKLFFSHAFKCYGSGSQCHGEWHSFLNDDLMI